MSDAGYDTERATVNYYTRDKSIEVHRFEENTIYMIHLIESPNTGPRLPFHERRSRLQRHIRSVDGLVRVSVDAHPHR